MPVKRLANCLLRPSHVKGYTAVHAAYNRAGVQNLYRTRANDTRMVSVVWRMWPAAMGGLFWRCCQLKQKQKQQKLNQSFQLRILVNVLPQPGIDQAIPASVACDSHSPFIQPSHLACTPPPVLVLLPHLFPHHLLLTLVLVLRQVLPQLQAP